MSYAWRKLRKAVDSLVDSGSSRQRLQQALIHVCCLKAKDLPREARPDFNIIMQRLKARSTGETEPDIITSVSDAEIALTINRIVEMFDKVARYQPMESSSLENESHL